MVARCVLLMLESQVHSCGVIHRVFPPSHFQERPFTMEKKEIHKYKGNDRYEGFCVDLVAEIGKLLNFNFDLYLVPDGKFGAKNEDGEWNGVIRELLNGVCI